MTAVWSMPDLGHLEMSAAALASGPPARNPLQRELKLAEQFVSINRATLAKFGVTTRLAPNPQGVSVHFKAQHQIGALALASPSTGGFDFGLVIRPRFGWRGVGALMGEVGATVMPEIPKLPMLPKSEHEVPRWVLAAIVLSRLEALMSQPQRKFLSSRQDLRMPRGRIEWNQYVIRGLARNKPEDVPCVFSDLQEDPILLGTVHAAVLAQLASLQQVKNDSSQVARLLARYQSLRRQVAAHAPNWNGLRLLRSAVSSPTWDNAVEAMKWTCEERGLAGQATFAGLPWKMSMEKVFEARVESVSREIARRAGGVVRTGRLRETQRAIRWTPPYSGSQRALVPDVEIVSQRATIVLDAKYKAHFEDLDASGWDRASDDLKEAHRADLMQILAYGATAAGETIICILVYPCKVATWHLLRQRGKAIHTASIPAGSRNVSLVLAAIPFEVPVSELAAEFIQSIYGAARY